VPNISTITKRYQITLEASKTGSGLDWELYTIPMDYKVTEVTSIYSTATGTGGTEYYSATSGITWLGNVIYFPAGAIPDDTNVWVTYIVDQILMVGGTPIGDGLSALAVAPTILSAITGESDYSTPVDYEISNLTNGQTLAAEIRFVPPLKNVVITQIEVTTNGTNISVGIYPGTATTGTTTNIAFMKTGINTVYNSSTEFPNLRVVIEDDAWRLGIVDTGANATPAGTKVTVRGYPLI
jgi:hypothetical protein